MNAPGSLFRHVHRERWHVLSDTLWHRLLAGAVAAIIVALAVNSWLT